jgi:hypothetical protein
MLVPPISAASAYCSFEVVTFEMVAGGVFIYLGTASCVILNLIQNHLVLLRATGVGAGRRSPDSRVVAG